jgi:hypothetical protein
MNKIVFKTVLIVAFFGSILPAVAQFSAVNDEFVVSSSSVPLVVGNVLTNDNLNSPAVYVSNPILAGPITLSAAGEVSVQPNLDPMCFAISYTICIPGTILCSTAVCLVTVTPLPPVAPLMQSLPFNSTLANLVVSGQNILWYANPTAGRSVTEVPLPLSTPLVNGTTYYASQTVNGIESKERLPVTVTLSALATANYTFANFSYYFDADASQLELNNATTIDQIQLFDLTGKSLFTNAIGLSKATVGLPNLETGTYVVVLQSQGSRLTFKVVKQ